MSELILKKESFDPIKIDFVKQSGLTESVFYKEVSFAIQIISANPYMKQCTQSSVLKSVLNVAQVGLSLNPMLKFAYLVPRYNSKTKSLEAVLDPSYQGYAKLLTDSGTVKNIQCNIIYEDDVIEIDFASDEKVKKHSPNILAGKKRSKEIIGCYSLATLPDGTKHIEYMSIDEIKEIRERSESYKSFIAKKTNSCIWVTDESEMCRKTVIKRHYKYLPKSNVLDNISKAIELDNAVNGYKLSESQLTLIENLCHSSQISDESKRIIESEMFDYDSIQASKCIEYLKQNQREDLNEQFDKAIKLDAD